MDFRRRLAAVVAGLGIVCAGCSTKYAEKKINEPLDDQPYTGFSPKAGKDSERKIRLGEPVSDDMDAEKATGILVKRLESQERALAIPAENELRYWAAKQGVAPIVVNRVRPFLQHPRIEVRAPALRLTIVFGKKESCGDLIEVLADEAYGMRSTAFKALKARTGRDFGYSPSGGELARAKSLQSWRKWWQDEQGLPAEKPPEQAEQSPEETVKASPPAPPPVPEAPQPNEARPPEEVKASSPTEVLLPPPKNTAAQ